MVLRIFSVVIVLMASVSAFSQTPLLPPIEKGVSSELAKWRSNHYSDIRYKLDLTLERNSPVVKGTIEISLYSRSKPRVVNLGYPFKKPVVGTNGRVPIILDWRKIRGREQLSKVSNVSVNGNSVSLIPSSGNKGSNKTNKTKGYLEINQHLIFLKHVRAGKNIIKLDFESPILKSGGAVTRFIDKEDGAEYIYSLFVPSDASTAFPVFDQPDLKARFKLQMRVPTGWQAITNANLEYLSSDKDLDKLGKPKSVAHIFSETKPISTYVFAFASGEFSEFQECSHPSVGSGSSKRYYRSRPCKNMAYVRKSQAKKFKPHAKELFRLNRESINFFEKYFNYKFPFPKYDLVLIPEFPFGGMEHAGATFLRESSMIFPTEPTANNYISRAQLLFHENAHQWFGDTVTMKWFDDLWLKEGFATFMAYKAMEKVMPQYNAWKVFNERTKPRAYSTDVTKGTTPIYQKIPNLNSAKSAYGNIVYNKAPSFLRQAEFYLGEDKFKTAVRAFLKDHEFRNAEWSDLVAAFEKSSGQDLEAWANVWVKKRGLPIIRIGKGYLRSYAKMGQPHDTAVIYSLSQEDALGESGVWLMKTKVLLKFADDRREVREVPIAKNRPNTKMGFARYWTYIHENPNFKSNAPVFVFPNYGDYAYGIFLLDPRSKKYALENIQNEKDDFLRSMMWGALWDSVRFAELAPKEFIELAISNIDIEKDVTTISSILNRVNTAFTYYLSETQQKQLAPQLEGLLIDKMKTAKTQGERITFYRAFLRTVSSETGKQTLKQILRINSNTGPYSKVRKTKTAVAKIYRNTTLSDLPIRTRDKFNILTRLIILGDEEAPKLLADLEKSETSDAAKRYAYAAKAGFATKENKEKYWNDFVNNKEISESWIQAAFGVWNSPVHSDLTLPYLAKALAKLPDHKANRKIFFVNGWTASFISGQKSKIALSRVNRFLAENPQLDSDLRRKVLERLDGLERAVRIREKYSK